MHELARMTWPEVEDVLQRARLGIVPTGSCEQHGPHLELGTDAAIANAFARRLAADLGAAAVLCPALAYGLSEHHLAFPGTLTLRPTTFMALLGDVVESLARWGLRRVLVVNGHGGNLDAIRLAARSARLDHGVLVGGIMWSQLAAAEIRQWTDSSAYGHACEVETSVAMAIAPDLVRPDAIRHEGGRYSVDALTAPPAPRADLPVWLHEWSDDGALGNPAGASAEFGEAVIDVAYDRALAFARRLADTSLEGLVPSARSARSSSPGGKQGGPA